MNTKGAAWVGKAEIERISLHTLEFRSQSRHSVFFTLGEEGTIDLTKKGNAESAFILLHTPSDFVLFRSESIKLSFSGIEAVIPCSIGNHLAMDKNGTKLTFRDGDRTILELNKEAFSSSASFGIAAEGPGSVYIEVF